MSFLGIIGAGCVAAPVDPSEAEERQVCAARAIGAAAFWKNGCLHLLDAGSRRRPRPPTECLVKLTSGSSGAPRGLAASHGQMAADGRQICSSMGIRAEDRNLATIPMGYSYGLGNLVMPLLLQGTPLVCASSALPHAIAAEVLRHRPTVLPSVPPILRALALSELPRGALASLRLVVSAGSPVGPEVARAFLERFGLPIHGFYGTSETGGISFDVRGDATTEGRSVGTPLRGVSVFPGRKGRFVVSSRAVLGSGRFSPADRGRINGRGELVLLGRTDRVVKIAGRRVDLAEIESALKSVPGVRDAFAHSGAGPEASIAVAALTLRAPAELRMLLRARLAPWKVPSRVIALAEFPTTARGKTDGHKLRQFLSAPRTVASISTLRDERQIAAPR